MIFVSLPPYSFNKLFLFVAGLIYLVAVSCFADSLFLAVDSTPGQQVARSRAVLSTRNEAHRYEISSAIVNHRGDDSRGISCELSPEWKTPPGLESGPATDCKGKAVALYQGMQAPGVWMFAAADQRRVLGPDVWLEWAAGDGT